MKNMLKGMQVETLAHEAYGHAYIYEQTNDVEKSSHIRETKTETYFDEEFQVNGYINIGVETNKHYKIR